MTATPPTSTADAPAAAGAPVVPMAAPAGSAPPAPASSTTMPVVAPPSAAEAALAELLITNGIDATTGEYLLPKVTAYEVARLATGDRLDSDELGDVQTKARRSRRVSMAVVEGVDPNDLAQAGWAAVFPAVDTNSPAAANQAKIIAALEPLLAIRRTAAGARYCLYTGDLAYRSGETKQQYLARLGAVPGPARPDKVPYYLLLVGAPDEIPFHIQYQLDVHYAVGRISFDSLEDYAAYARSVADAETGAINRARRMTFFGVANPNDSATRLSADHLVMPLASYVDGRSSLHGFSVDCLLEADATHGKLGEVLSDPPAILFTASHGMGFPSGDAKQRENQGALLCQDWPGPGNPVARQHYFAAEDLPPAADLRGMIGVMFACFGGGTPLRDEFTRRALAAVSPKPLAPAPLIARLPQRMLAHPGGGALAVIGHVDRAWGSAFLWVDPQGRSKTQASTDTFQSMLDALLDGKRIGYAMESFNLRYAELAADLSERIQEIENGDEHYDDSELANMWICNNDARNYAVFGDPAVRLTNAGRVSSAKPADASTVAPDVTPPVTPAPAPSPAPAVTAPVSDTSVVPNTPAFGWFGDKDDTDDGKQAGLLARLGTKLGEVLGSVLSDVSVLEVKTYTSADLPAVASGEAIPAGARLRAYTRCALDGDTEVCVPVNAQGAVDDALWALHVEMVKQAQAHRTELLKTVLSLFSRGKT